MAAPMVDRPSEALAVSGDAWRHRVRRSPLGAGLILGAVLIGLVLGALTCAAGLADGSGHAAHRNVAAGDAAALQDGRVLGDDHTSHGPASHESRLVPDDSSSLGSGEASAVPFEAHPGMACLVPVDLRFRDPVVATSSDICAPLGPVALARGTVDLDPPVPRPS